MHIETTRQLRLTTAEGTLPRSIDIPAGTRGEVPEAVGKRMIDAGEAIEIAVGEPVSLVETHDAPADDAGAGHGKKGKKGHGKKGKGSDAPADDAGAGHQE